MKSNLVVKIPFSFLVINLSSFSYSEFEEGIAGRYNSFNERDYSDKLLD